MLTILADVLLIAMGSRPMNPSQNHNRGTQWNHRFPTRPVQDNDRTHTKRDLNW